MASRQADDAAKLFVWQTIGELMLARYYASTDEPLARLETDRKFLTDCLSSVDNKASSEYLDKVYEEVRQSVLIALNRNESDWRN